MRARYIYINTPEEPKLPKAPKARQPKQAESPTETDTASSVPGTSTSVSLCIKVEAAAILRSVRRETAPVLEAGQDGGGETDEEEENLALAEYGYLSAQEYQHLSVTKTTSRLFYLHIVEQNWFMLLTVRISSYGCNWNLRRAIKKLECSSSNFLPVCIHNLIYQW